MFVVFADFFRWLERRSRARSFEVACERIYREAKYGEESLARARIDELSPQPEDESVLADLAQRLTSIDSLTLALAVVEIATRTPKTARTWDVAARVAVACNEPPERVAEWWRRALTMSPGDPEIGARFGAWLLERGDVDPAEEIARSMPQADNRTTVLRAKCLFAKEQNDAAAALLRPLRDRLAGTLRQFEGDRDAFHEASQLLDEIDAESLGHEEVVTEYLRLRLLDGSAGTSHLLLAKPLLVGAPRRAKTLHLVGPIAEEADARAALAAAPDDSDALARLGVIELRLAHLDEAERLLKKAVEADRSNFTAHLGLAATLDTEHWRLRDRIRELPLRMEPPSLRKVVPDFDALTDLERRVVLVSISPLRSALPTLERIGARIRILPTDVRPIDLPELGESAGNRVSDHRAVDSLEGLADDELKLAIAKIENLCDIASPAAWIFGHEYAHLVHFFLPVHLKERIAALHARALREPGIFSDYALSNEWEFLAVGYTDYLHHRHGQRTFEFDEGGLRMELHALLDELDERDEEP